MSYDAALTELRQLLGDTVVDKRSSRKAMIGPIDGENKSFRTYDKRIVENSVQVFLNNAEVSFTVDDAVAGEITLSNAPDKNTKLQATYYWQWWTDDELKNFLNKGAESVGITDQTTPDTAYTLVPGGLKTAVLYYSASHAMQRLIVYMLNRRHSGEFLLEQDKGGDEGFASLIKSMQDQQKGFEKSAGSYRDDFYKRQGRQYAPVVRVKAGSTKNYGPQR